MPFLYTCITKYRNGKIKNNSSYRKNLIPQKYTPYVACCLQLLYTSIFLLVIRQLYLLRFSKLNMKIEHVFNCLIFFSVLSIMQLNPHLNWICKLAVMAYLNSEMYIWSILYLLLSSFINKQCNLGVGKGIVEVIIYNISSKLKSDDISAVDLEKFVTVVSLQVCYCSSWLNAGKCSE